MQMEPEARKVKERRKEAELEKSKAGSWFKGDVILKEPKSR